MSGSNTIRVTGQSSVEVVPDIVAVYFNVQTKGDTSKEAKDKNSEIVSEARSALINLGFSKEEIQTSGFNIYEDRDYSTGRSRGFIAAHNLVVKFPSEEVEKIGDVVDTGVNAGASVNYIGFELSPERHNLEKAKAVELAAQDANLKAEALASGLDKNVGKLVSVSDSSFGYNPWIDFRAAEGASIDEVKEAATEIQPSERKVSASVTAVFKIV